jgi:uncharacterized repeat protein (TIGR03803 family)
LVQGSDGNFYGTAQVGGNWGYGTIFRITPNGILTTLYSFTGGNDGYWPVGALVQGSDGNLYGTTWKGGTSGDGTIFRIAPAGKFATLHTFQGGSEGIGPQAAMVQGQDGNLYGTTVQGGTNNCGTVFRLVIPPVIQSIVLTGSQPTFTFSSVPGQTYQVQYASDLTSTNWSNLTSQLAASFSTTTISDFTSLTNKQRFYRVVEFPVAW